MKVRDFASHLPEKSSKVLVKGAVVSPATPQRYGREHAGRLALVRNGTVRGLLSKIRPSAAAQVGARSHFKPRAALPDHLLPTTAFARAEPVLPARHMVGAFGGGGYSPS